MQINFIKVIVYPQRCVRGARFFHLSPAAAFFAVVGDNLNDSVIF